VKWRVKYDLLFSTNSDASEHDPFTAPTPTATRSGLSPTATSFTPGQVQVSRNARGQILTASGRISTACIENDQGEGSHGRVSSLHANSVPDLATPQVTHVAQAHSSHGAVGEPSPPHGLANVLGQLSLGSARTPTYEGHYRFSSVYEGTLTSDEAAQRAIKIVGDPGNRSVTHLQARFNVSTP
jgi:hypothetical protein